MSTQYDFIPGAVIGECVTPAELELLVRNAWPENHLALLLVGDVAPNVASNPRYARYIWVDTRTTPPTRRYWDGTQWAFWGFAPQTLNGAALINGTLPLLSISITDATLGDVIRVGATDLYFTPPIEIFDNNELPVNKLTLGEEAEEDDETITSVITSDGVVNTWQDANDLVTGIVDAKVKKRVQYAQSTGGGIIYDFELEHPIKAIDDLIGVILLMKCGHTSVSAGAFLKVRNPGAAETFESTGIQIVNSNGSSVGNNTLRINRIVELTYVPGTGKFQVLSEIPREQGLNNVITYRSEAVSIPAHGTVTEFVHGLGAIPEIVQAKLVRGNTAFVHRNGGTIPPNSEINAECIWNYSRGTDLQMFGPSFRIWADLTKIYISVYRPAGLGMVWNSLAKNEHSGHLDAGSLSPFDSASWSLRAVGMAFNLDLLGSTGSGASTGSEVNAPEFVTNVENQDKEVGETFEFTITGIYASTASWEYDGVETAGSRFTITTTLVESVLTSILSFVAIAGDNGKTVSAVIYGDGASTKSATPATLTITA